MIPSIGQTPIRLLFLAVAVCGVLLLLFNGVSPVEARVKLDFDLDPANADAAGIWGNDETFWVANDGKDGNNKIYAYHRSDGSRDPSKDFNTLNAAGNVNPRGIWSDGTTMFVVEDKFNTTFCYACWFPEGKYPPTIDGFIPEALQEFIDTHDHLYAYRMSNKSRDPGKDIVLKMDNYSTDPQAGLVREPTDVWGNDDTIWVANDGHVHFGQAPRIYAYKRSNGKNDPGKDFILRTAPGIGGPDSVRNRWRHDRQNRLRGGHRKPLRHVVERRDHVGRGWLGQRNIRFRDVQQVARFEQGLPNCHRLFRWPDSGKWYPRPR